MNLVAKEYVACRFDGDGALVLSEFAGAAGELRQAFMVNPYDINGMKDAVMQAVHAPASDRTKPDEGDAEDRRGARRGGLGRRLPGRVGRRPTVPPQADKTGPAELMGGRPRDDDRDLPTPADGYPPRASCSDG